MRRKRLLLLAGVAPALAVLAVGVLTRHALRGRVTLATRTLIRPGMSQAEVEAVLGGPPGDYATRPLVYTRNELEIEGDIWGPRSATWRADDGRLLVVFAEAGKVQGTVCIPGSATRQPSLAERVRDWFRGGWP
jgi:hypothetical protein